MSRYDTLHLVERTGVVAILRKPPGDIVQMAKALVDGGVTVLEVTADTPDFLNALRRLKDEVEGATVGVGTVLDAETARLAILSGAEFIVCPTLSAAVIEVGTRYDKLVLPGAFTPTEILRAWELGAPAVKVFPAATLGPEFIKHVRGPLPQVPMIPTGGVDLNNAGAFIAAGAAAVGLGGSLVRKAEVETGNYAAVSERARQAVDVVRSARRRGE
ncbi:MAG: bifunctional 4-hydroxy-2-oxoglutarate aldolase/2-dehydro-3-deoxy-phosphogluconate aldolase [Firmicutes bacterium]|jgi:2-dehydro-3-deoxyphosphogluconate aldolase/(4S)-4-hydroxy-2-oxoglutarate aldolase|nr:bifunctional 4-hydroxy-2-oxoglutarate aldolase/2-dehydro-3-deoxy-phosphogluconate aldolase [Bacillota bacterium]